MQISKRNVPIICPECSSTVHIGIEHSIPRVTDVFSDSQAQAARSELLQKLSSLNVDEATKDTYRQFVSDPENHIGPGDVSLVLTNALTQYEQQMAAKKAGN